MNKWYIIKLFLIWILYQVIILLFDHSEMIWRLIEIRDHIIFPSIKALIFDIFCFGC